MIALSAQQANDLANNFLGLAQAIGDFRYHHRDSLSSAENQKLGRLQWSILKYGEDILALSTSLVMEDAAESISQIKQVTTRIKGSIQKLQNVQKGIDIAASIVTLGAAIVSKNPPSIITAINDVVETWNA